LSRDLAVADISLRDRDFSCARRAAVTPLPPTRPDGMLGAMSREDRVRNAISAVNERDVEAYLACCTDDIQLYTPIAHFTGPNEGTTGIRRFFQDIEDASPDFHLELERFELVGDQALAFLRAHGSGRVSGVPLDFETANVYDFEGDRIKRIRIFFERREALELLGIPE
jgi:hypothetical protein